jgi:DNA polymerase-3 subunit delta'
VNLATAADVWADVVGQPNAVAQLTAAGRSPVHAYLFVGPPGSGKRAAARAFAAELLSDGLDPDAAERARVLALGAQHPDLVVFSPRAARLSAEELTAAVTEATRSPVEGDRKVVVLCEMHRIEHMAPKLLKTIEEPPAPTVFIVVADEVVPDLVTIASRCVRVDFGPVADAAVAARLEAEGVEAAQAAEAAVAAGGDLERARLLATDERLGLRRQAWRSVPDRLDGTGAAVATLVDELRALIDDAQAPLDALHAGERAELDAREELYGTRGSGRRELVENQKRDVRRHRTVELRFGLATLAARYRDAIVDAPAPRSLVEAIAAIQATAEGLIRNPAETLLLDALLLRLPPIS